MPDPAPDQKNTKAIKVAVSIAIEVATIAIMFAPMVPIQYEEIVGELGDPNGGPVGRMVSKYVCLFQIMGGTE